MAAYLDSMVGAPSCSETNAGRAPMQRAMHHRALRSPNKRCMAQNAVRGAAPAARGLHTSFPSSHTAHHSSSTCTHHLYMTVYLPPDPHSQMKPLPSPAP